MRKMGKFSVFKSFFHDSRLILFCRTYFKSVVSGFALFIGSLSCGSGFSVHTGSGCHSRPARVFDPIPELAVSYRGVSVSEL